LQTLAQLRSDICRFSRVLLHAQHLSHFLKCRYGTLVTVLVKRFGNQIRHSFKLLEKFLQCRYLPRPAVSEQRLALTRDGRVRYELKTPYRDGTPEYLLKPGAESTTMRGPRKLWVV